MRNNENTYPYKTVTELQNEFHDCWVLLLNADYNSDFEIVGGSFVAKGKKHEKVWEKSKSITGNGLRFSAIYTGKIEVPDNVILCL